MRSAITFLFCVCASFVLEAQSNVPPADSVGAAITFDTKYFNCGKVIVGATIIHEFKFTNTGDAPLIISDITRTGAGFVPDAFPKEPIAPGKSRVIKMSYNTTGKNSGEFWKEQSVYSNGSEKPAILYLNGYVVDPNGPVMKFDTTTYWFDTVYQSSIVQHDFRFTNTGKTPLIISTVTGNSGCIVPEYPKEPIAPGQSAVISVRFHTGGKLGMQDKCVTVTSNATEPVIVLHLKGIVIVPKPPTPIIIGPVMHFDTTNFNFGTVTQGDTIYHDYRFSNKGKEPLLISSVIGSGGGAAALAYPHEPIAPGKTGVITIGYITGGTGFHDKSFIITSNNSKGDVYIHMTGTVLARDK
jgi:hypothetical protein